MAKDARRSVGMAVATMLIVVATPAAGDARETIVLSVENRCQMLRFELEAAQKKAATIYDEIGIDLVWLPAGVAPPPGLTGSLRLRVVLADKATEKLLAAAGLRSEPLGVAPEGSFSLYVFCRRISSRVGANATTVLGRVLAHEIGHQVLPGMGHSDTGLMQSIIDYGPHKAAGFTGTQAQSIQALLMAHRTRP